jgi:hypothetical protein
MHRWLMSAVTTVSLTVALAAVPALADTVSTTADTGTTALDVRALGRAAALEGCATRKFVDGRPRGLKVRYGMLQRTITGTRGSFVLRNHAGAWRFCDMFGADGPSRMPLPKPTAERVAVHLTNPDWAPVCKDGVRTGMRTNAFLRVTDVVRSARTRFWVDGEAQPWFASKRQGRIVHLQSWQQGLPAGAKLMIQTQLRDRDGKVLAIKGLPSRPRPMTNGCVQIG